MDAYEQTKTFNHECIVNFTEFFRKERMDLYGGNKVSTI